MVRLVLRDALTNAQVVIQSVKVALGHVQVLAIRHALLHVVHRVMMDALVLVWEHALVHAMMDVKTDVKLVVMQHVSTAVKQAAA